MRILVTGAAGAVGMAVVKGMKDRYSLRGFDRASMPEIEDAIVGDVTDFDTALKATQDMEAMIHLAGNPSGGAPWEDILQNNIIGTYNVFEAARQNGVRRIAFASRAGLLAPYPKDIMRTVDMTPRPETYYSISKVFGENLGYMYSARFDMEFVSVRIGNFKRDRDLPNHPHQLSHGDAARVFEQAVISPLNPPASGGKRGVKFEVVFGVSDSTWALYDLEHGRQVINYHPQDKSDAEPEV